MSRDAIHQCPYCELRFLYANEVKDHVINDHPDHADAFLQVEVHEFPTDDAPRGDHNRSASPHRRIADSLDPTFAGDPTAAADRDEKSATDENIAIVEGDLGDVLQMTERSSPLDVLNDPEDELLDLPAEEEAMHVVPDEADDPSR